MAVLVLTMLILTVNFARVQRVADLLLEFTALQRYIASTPSSPPHPDDYNTAGWVALRQCDLDGQNILYVAADTQVPLSRGGAEEQDKAELQQCVSQPRSLSRYSCQYLLLIRRVTRVLLDAFSRRHEAQKIYERHGAIQRWIGCRDNVLCGQRPQTCHAAQLAACDRQLQTVSAPISSFPSSYERLRKLSTISIHSKRPAKTLPEQELAGITDEAIYSDLRSSDYQLGRWTQEDPSLRNVQRWVRSRR